MSQTDFFSSFSTQMEPLLQQFTKVGEMLSQPMRSQLLLVFNHVIAQEPEAMARLKVYAGRRMMLEGPMGKWLLAITPAGLFEEAAAPTLGQGAEAEMTEIQADLHLKMKMPTPADVGNMLLKGQKPPVDIDGDADLAAVFAWIVENVRWDYAEDLSRIVGDAPAQFAVDQLHNMVALFRRFLDAFAKRAPGSE